MYTTAEEELGYCVSLCVLRSSSRSSNTASQSSSHLSTSIGGVPRVFGADFLATLPVKCPCCDSAMQLLSQVYTPMPNGLLRQLYVFCCVEKDCYTKQPTKCWRAIRWQTTNHPAVAAATPPIEATVGTGTQSKTECKKKVRRLSSVLVA